MLPGSTIVVMSVSPLAMQCGAVAFAVADFVAVTCCAVQY